MAKGKEKGEGEEELREKAPSEVKMTQYLRPDGATRPLYADVGEEVVELADGMSLSCEQLSTGEIAIYARFQSEPEEDEIMDLAVNGPGDRSPANVLAALIRRKARRREEGANVSN